MLEPIAAKGKGHVEIVQLIDPNEEAYWIAKKVSALIGKGVHESEIIVLIQRARMARSIADARLEEARRLFFVGITRAKADPQNGKPGTLFISYPKEMNAGEASGASVAFEYIRYGQAQLMPSQFLQELGPTAPKPTKG